MEEEQEEQEKQEKQHEDHKFHMGAIPFIGSIILIILLCIIFIVSMLMIVKYRFNQIKPGSYSISITSNKLEAQLKINPYHHNGYSWVLLSNNGVVINSNMILTKWSGSAIILTTLNINSITYSILSNGTMSDGNKIIKLSKINKNSPLIAKSSAAPVLPVITYTDGKYKALLPKNDVAFTCTNNNDPTTCACPTGSETIYAWDPSILNNTLGSIAITTPNAIEYPGCSYGISSTGNTTSSYTCADVSDPTYYNAVQCITSPTSSKSSTASKSSTSSKSSFNTLPMI